MGWKFLVMLEYLTTTQFIDIVSPEPSRRQRSGPPGTPSASWGLPAWSPTPTPRRSTRWWSSWTWTVSCARLMPRTLCRREPRRMSWTAPFLVKLFMSRPKLRTWRSYQFKQFSLPMSTMQVQYIIDILFNLYWSELNVTLIRIISLCHLNLAPSACSHFR